MTFQTYLIDEKRSCDYLGLTKRNDNIPSNVHYDIFLNGHITKSGYCDLLLN